MAHIVHLTTVHRPFDTRIFQRECRTLAQAGYSVSLVAPHSTRETVDGVKIVPIPGLSNRQARGARFTRGLWSVYWLARHLQADLYHFHDPELLPVGILLKLTTPARLVYDVHENHSKKIQAREWLPRPLRKAASWLMTVMEKAAIPLMDGVVAVTMHISSKFPPDKTRVVRNYPLLSMMALSTDGQRVYEDNHTLIYTGGLSNHRGIYQIVQALNYVKTPNVVLIILGGLQDRETAVPIKELPGWNQVNYYGQVPYGKVSEYLNMAAIGLVCSQPVYDYDKALPNKLFEYMAAGLPVITSNFALWKEVVEGNQCGVTVDSTQPEDIAQAIDNLLAHPENRRTMGANAQRAIREKYHWEHESMKLLNLYKEILT
jgi:glycosyltransferase involved in cell wall biosynthesis